MKPLSQAKRIIGKFGGRQQMSRSTRYSYERIRAWEKAGFIPQDLHQEIMQEAAALSIELLPYEFIAHLEPVRLENESAVEASR
jgi:hypothetical protein